MKTQPLPLNECWEAMQKALGDDSLPENVKFVFYAGATAVVHHILNCSSEEEKAALLGALNMELVAFVEKKGNDPD